MQIKGFKQCGECKTYYRENFSGCPQCKIPDKKTEEESYSPEKLKKDHISFKDSIVDIKRGI
ncbi:MAG: hypothetical protein ISS45_04115 [Candidatus Omnitrophica bacterium]|nr:hypothetical protein [Candidatus Omnitrophota bacterium]